MAAIFKSRHKCSIGLKSGLRLSRSRTFYFLLIQPLQCGFSFVLQVIVLLKCESPTQFQIHGRCKQDFNKDSPVLCTIYCPFYVDKLASPCWWIAAPLHDVATTIIQSRDGVDWVMFLVRLVPDFTLWIWTKKFNFCLVWPQKLSPQACIIIKTVFGKLHTSF